MYIAKIHNTVKIIINAYSHAKINASYIYIYIYILYIYIHALMGGFGAALQCFKLSSKISSRYCENCVCDGSHRISVVRTIITAPQVSFGDWSFCFLYCEMIWG